ncbi:pyridoxamine 5'-phosphate oxidase family protein [Paenibacillus dakarensis]|uniref:pyridoxamine 5'-phosphate oxidase family protein n=1 Tax=Paenibacillus dakarensis TaxID=1527293 RepID=UPI0006D5950C|nr:pyridoxamine 5'-phosphate oxidase family protein [Paenibacillus dakarensis]
MRRSEFLIDNPEEVEQFLGEMSFGFLGTVDEAGCPRVTPLNFVFAEGAFYFHGSRSGEKMDHLFRNPQVSFTVADEYALIPSYFSDPVMACPATAFFKSVTASGNAVVVDDLEEKALALGHFMHKLQPEGGYDPIDAGDPRYVPQLKGVALIKLIPDRMSAKFKFGQNMKPRRRDKVVNGLKNRNENRDAVTVEQICKYHPSSP